MPVTIQIIEIQASIEKNSSEKMDQEQNKNASDDNKSNVLSSNVDSPDNVIDINEIVLTCMDEVKQYLKELKEK